MTSCIICRFDVVLDDVAVSTTGTGRGICVRCFRRETGSSLHMSTTLRRELTALLSDVQQQAA
jgi:hypothetical protein